MKNDLLDGERVIEVETKQRGRPPIIVRSVQTTPYLFMRWLHDKLLEAKRENKKLEVKS